MVLVSPTTKCKYNYYNYYQWMCSFFFSFFYSPFLPVILSSFSHMLILIMMWTSSGICLCEIDNKMKGKYIGYFIVGYIRPAEIQKRKYFSTEPQAVKQLTIFFIWWTPSMLKIYKPYMNWIEHNNKNKNYITNTKQILHLGKYFHWTHSTTKC